jgi:hypothetical protein
VVSSFIFKFPDEDDRVDNKDMPQVALFRRSDRVRTYWSVLKNSSNGDAGTKSETSLTFLSIYVGTCIPYVYTSLHALSIVTQSPTSSYLW